MARTSSTLVGQIIEVDSSISLDPFIKAATVLVDQVAASSSAPSVAVLKQIETWVAAHFYAMRDPGASPSSEQVDGIRVTYQGRSGLGLESTRYGQMAITLDPTGVLRNLYKGSVSVGVQWMGTTLENEVA